VNEDDSLVRYGLRPASSDLDQIRELLEGQEAHESQRQGDGDTELMKLCCVQLFNVGFLNDVLLIWRAKESSWDAHCSIDVQLLCGAGLEMTREYLAAEGSHNASAALNYLRQCEAAGDFADFSVENQSRWYSKYYTHTSDRMTSRSPWETTVRLEQDGNDRHRHRDQKRM
jgi:hypothetical protein